MIDKDKLRELLEADPKAKTEPIWRGLGFKNDVGFYYHLKKDPEAQKMFHDAKKAATAARIGGDEQAKASARAPQQKSKKKRASKRAAPPRNSHAKAGISDELLRKIRFEFEHIALYESISDHFDDVREELEASRQ